MKLTQESPHYMLKSRFQSMDTNLCPFVHIHAFYLYISTSKSPVKRNSLNMGFPSLENLYYF